MWFDVGVKRYTTDDWFDRIGTELWFDVGVKRYTTSGMIFPKSDKLWFDVGVKRYTTIFHKEAIDLGCGLM